ncbi:peptidyl-prolyl cis-trans isomerase FKBP8-like [Apostichopus japonicus]|uniref:peptidyl-prolyl cis-trans isomerase FKBP8-like n=1 Tax=Stichopus japonicus TaxID=307972 RepID=UPI003AB27B2C
MEQDTTPEDAFQDKGKNGEITKTQEETAQNQNDVGEKSNETKNEGPPKGDETKVDEQLQESNKKDDVETETLSNSEEQRKSEKEVKKQDAKENVEEESNRVEDVKTSQSPSTSMHPSKPGANVNDSWGIFQEGWLDILGNGELQKKILTPGKGHTTRPKADQIVTLRTKGWLEDGTEIDWNDSITICLGDGDAVQAWDLAAILMEDGEKAVIIAAPRFAYGEEGREPDVPPNSLVRYELELLEVKDATDVKDMTTDERCQTADQKREQGNKCFAKGDFANAISSYRRAISFIEELHPTGSKEDIAKINAMKVKCYNNLTAAQLKVEAYDAALKSCNTALSLDPNSVKALFRKGKVLANQLNLKEAIVSMKKALALEPSNKTIHQELSKVTAKVNKEKEDEKQLYQKMVGDMANITEVTETTEEEEEPVAVKSRGISMWVLIGSASLIAISGVLIAVLLMK